MVCPNCGAALEDFDVFCPGCGKTIQKNPDGTLTAVDPQPAADPVEAPPKKVAKRLYPPEEAEAPAAPAAEKPSDESPEPSPEPSAPDSEAPAPAAPEAPVPPETQPDSKASDPGKKRLLILAIVLGLVAIAAIAAAVSFYLKTDGLRVQAQKAQMENAAAQATLEDAQDQLTSLQSKYDAALADNDQLSSQVDDLSGQIRDMKSSVSQSEYDKATAQKELEDAQADLKALNDSVSELNTQLTEAQDKLDEVQKANETLTAANNAYEDEVGFYDTYVVFVMLGSDTKYYHKYDCKNFEKRNFLAYSTKLAEANGYSPCPICCGNN